MRIHIYAFFYRKKRRFLYIFHITTEFIMKVVLFNGSRRERGCTYTALSLVAGVEQPVAEKKVYTNFIR